ETLGNPILEFVALHNLGEVNDWYGDLTSSQTKLELALAKSQGIPSWEIIHEVGFDWWTLTAAESNITNLALGMPDRQPISGEQIANRARSSSHPFTRAVGLMFAVLTGHFRDLLSDFELRCLAESRALCDEYGFSEVLAFLDQIEGWDRFQRGERGAG